MSYVTSIILNNVTYTLSAQGVTPPTATVASSSVSTGSLILLNTVTANSTVYTVTALGYGVFADRSGFTGTLTLPSSLINISFAAFRNCTGFTGALIIPNTVTRIEGQAFTACKFSSLTMSSGITYIGQSAFFQCTSFTGALVFASSATDVAIDESAFNGCNKFTSLTLPSTMTILYKNAFFNCTGFTGTLTLPSSLITIRDSPFSGCFGFTGSLTIPNSVTTIGVSAFQSCIGLNGTLTLSSSLTTIGTSAFSGCSGFNGTLLLPSSLTSIGANAFINSTNIINVIVLYQTICTVQTTSFPNISANQNSSISFYLTQSEANLTGNWVTIKDYYYTKNYNSGNYCFNQGTKILCLNDNLQEEYIAIEHLRKGNLVKTYKQGYKKIELIGYIPLLNNPDNFCSCMYKMEKTDSNELIDDLIVAGGHSILVDDLGEYASDNAKLLGIDRKIEDKYLLLSSLSNKFSKINDAKLYNIYHFVLENNGNNDEHFGICANGILSETMSRTVFKQANFILL